MLHRAVLQVTGVIQVALADHRSGTLERRMLWEEGGTE